MNQEKESVFSILSQIDVNKDIKTKNGLKYLPWASAVKHLLKHFPDSTWCHTTFNNLPYLKTESGCFVEVLVTVNGITRKQLHPVFDFRNQSIKNPNAMDINKSIQRALSKCIALHGLGLYIFDGEDLPDNSQDNNELANCDVKKPQKQQQQVLKPIQVAPKQVNQLADSAQKAKIKKLLGNQEYEAYKEFIETKMTYEQAEMRIKQMESKNVK